MAKVFSGEFGNTAGWIVVNDYTIHEPKQLKDRPFMVTRVPQRLQVKLHGVRAVETAEWEGDHFGSELKVDDAGNLVSATPEEDRKEGYARKRWISATGTFDDTITVFKVPEGPVSKFHSFDNVQIKPLPRGMVGGKYKATTSDGLRFSGMSSKDVPARGLMDGEPGSIWVDDGQYYHPKKPETLTAELYIDEEQFDQIFEAIRDGAANIEAAHVGIAAELFEGEMQASLSEPWMDREYGLLKTGDFVQTRARVDRLSVSFGGRLPVKPVDPDAIDMPDQRQPEASPMPVSPVHDAETKAILKRLHARGGWILAALAVLILIMLAK